MRASRRRTAVISWRTWGVPRERVGGGAAAPVGRPGAGPGHAPLVCVRCLAAGGRPCRPRSLAGGEPPPELVLRGEAGGEGCPGLVALPRGYRYSRPGTG